MPMPAETSRETCIDANTLARLLWYVTPSKYSWFGARLILISLCRGP